MTKWIPNAACMLLIFFSCSCSEQNRVYILGELTALEKIEKVKMFNNSGTFYLTPKQISRFKSELSGMIYEPGISVKAGGISMELTIEGKTFVLSSNTHGEYLEVPGRLLTKNNNSIDLSDWHCFKTGKVNFDNYKNENP